MSNPLCPKTERERDEARAEIARLRSEHETDASIANIRVDNLEAEIARLREAGEELATIISTNYRSHAKPLLARWRSVSGEALDTQAREEE